MISPFTITIIALLCIAVLCLCLAYWCWKAPRIAGATSLVVLQIAVGIWAVLLLIQFLVAEPAYLYPFAIAQGWLRAIAAIAALAFLLDHATHRAAVLLVLRSGGAIALVLLIIIGLLNHDPYAWIAHAHPVQIEQLLLLATFSSPLRRSAELTGIALIMIGIALQVIAAHKIQTVYRSMLINSLMTAAAPLGGIILSRLMYGPDVRGFALYTDFMFIASIPLFTLGSILNNQLLTVMPFARDVVLDEISDAVIILDKNDTVLDANIAAINAMGLDRHSIVGCALPAIEAPLARKLVSVIKPGLTSLVLDGEASEQARMIYEVQTKVIRRPNSKRLGLLIKLHDVTREHAAKRALALTLARERKHLHTLTLLRVSMQRMSASLDMEPLTDVIQRHALALTNADTCAILAFDSATRTLSPIADYIGMDRPSPSHKRIPMFSAETLTDFAQQDFVIHNDYHAWMREQGIQIQPYDSAVVLAVPLLRNDQMIGILSVGRTSTDRPFAQEDGQLITLFAQQVAIALENARLYTSVRKQATTDALTGVLSRQEFADVLKREWDTMRDHHVPLSLIMFDADHFKRVNDTYGHAVGDQVLRAIAGRARGILRSQDSIGRYGGEEFVVMVPHTDAGTAQIIAERLRRAVSATPIATSGGNLQVSVSVGVTTADAEDWMHKTPDSLIDEADQAMYLAKRAGRNRVVHAATVELLPPTVN